MGILDKLADLLKHNDDMNLRMEIADAEKLLQSLDDGAIDFAIVESFLTRDAMNRSYFLMNRSSLSAVRALKLRKK